MTLRLYMDHHVPAAITEGLRSRGVDVLTALDDGTEEFEDPPLLQRATELDRVLFTQDTTSWRSQISGTKVAESSPVCSLGISYN